MSLLPDRGAQRDRLLGEVPGPRLGEAECAEVPEADVDSPDTKPLLLVAGNAEEDLAESSAVALESRAVDRAAATTWSECAGRSFGGGWFASHRRDDGAAGKKAAR